jgi:hypothetical protein
MACGFWEIRERERKENKAEFPSIIIYINILEVSKKQLHGAPYLPHCKKPSLGVSIRRPVCCIQAPSAAISAVNSVLSMAVTHL